MKAESKTHWGYSEACAVIDKLRAIGADAGISVGSIWFEPSTVEQAIACNQIIEECGGFILNNGEMSSLQADLIHRLPR